MTPRIDRGEGVQRDPTRAALRELARRVRRAARAMGCGAAQIDGIELRVVADAEMRVLKQAHFGLEEATDVLSFPAAPPMPGEDAPSLGEIVLNRDAVARQAHGTGPLAWLDEATSLCIHGVAHLLGHDHGQRAEARQMLACERRGTRAVRLPCARPYGH